MIKPKWDKNKWIETANIPDLEALEAELDSAKDINEIKSCLKKVLFGK